MMEFDKMYKEEDMSPDFFRNELRSAIRESEKADFHSPKYLLEKLNNALNNYKRILENHRLRFPEKW